MPTVNSKTSVSAKEVERTERTEMPAKEPKKAYRLTRGSISVEKSNGERRIVGIGQRILLTDAEATNMHNQIIPWVDEDTAEDGGAS